MVGLVRPQTSQSGIVESHIAAQKTHADLDPDPHQSSPISSTPISA
jgi:hypothetical protein